MRAGRSASNVSGSKNGGTRRDNTCNRPRTLSEDEERTLISLRMLLCCVNEEIDGIDGQRALVTQFYVRSALWIPKDKDITCGITEVLFLLVEVNIRGIWRARGVCSQQKAVSGLQVTKN